MKTTMKQARSAYRKERPLQLKRAPVAFREWARVNYGLSCASRTSGKLLKIAEHV